MVRRAFILVVIFAVGHGRGSSRSTAELILDWNATARQAIRADVSQANPGWSSRSLAMMSGAIYDSVMAIDRTHDPFLVDMPVRGAVSKEAAINQAAWRVLSATYPTQSATLDAAHTGRMQGIASGAAKQAGIALGDAVAQQYFDARAGDGASGSVPYAVGTAPGAWRPDPTIMPAQEAWGPAWGTVQPFALNSSMQFAPPPTPPLTSRQYANAFNEVKSLGAANSLTRTAEQTEIANFWAYDRAGMGPPPLMYNSHVSQIATLAGNTLEENARLFAMTMIAQADAGIAAWDSKFADNFWRPINAIREADTDGNPDTIADPNWTPLGAPAGVGEQNFTPPFPAYVSGHATFGSAVFTAQAHFYGTDSMLFELTSDELPVVVRSFSSFEEAALENGRSRIYLGIHWSFDDEQGRIMGGHIADWLAANYFAPSNAVSTPEPSSFCMAALALATFALTARRRSNRDGSRC